MGKLILISPDGRPTQVDQKDVQDYLYLGYREEQSNEHALRIQQEAEAEYYSSTGQQLKAGLEGFAGGATLGAADLFLADEATRKRAAYNPGTRFAGEMLGLIGPGLLSGGAGLVGRGARILPSGAAAAGGTKLAARLGGGLRGKVAAGGIEGALYGAGSEFTHAAVSGDPLTAEHILASGGLGMVIGAGGGALGHGLEWVGGRAKAARAKRMEDDFFDNVTFSGSTKTPTARAERFEMVPLGTTDPKFKSAIDAREAVSHSLLPDAEYQKFRSSVKEMRSAADAMLNKADEAHQAAVRAAKLAPDQRLQEMGRVGQSVLENAKPVAGNVTSLSKEANSVRSAWRWAQEAIKKGDPKKIEARMAAYQEAVDRLAAVSGQANIWPAGAKQVVTDIKAVGELTKASYDLWDEVNGAAFDSDKFFSMGRRSAENLFARVGAVLKNPLPEAQALRAQLEASIEGLVAKAGVTSSDGGTLDKLRALWAQGHEARNVAAEQYLMAQVKRPRITETAFKPPSQTMKGKRAQLNFPEGFAQPGKGDGIRSHIRNAAVGHAAWVAAGAVAPGSSWIVRSALSGLLLNLKGKAAGVVTAAASRLTLAGKAGRKASTYIYPLYNSMSGVQDPKGSLEDAFRARSEELRNAQVSIKDQAFMFSEELKAAGHPELGFAIYGAAPKVVEALMKRLPRSPIGTNWGLEYIWETPPEQLAIFSQEWQAGMTPLDFLTEAVEQPDGVFPSAVEVLKEAWPNIYSDFRASAVAALVEHGTQDMDAQELAGWSVLLDTPLSPLMAPEFIAAQAAMFADTRAQDEAKSATSGLGGGRPPGPGPSTSPGTTPGATRAQQLEAR